MTTLKVLATGSKGNCYLLESDGQILILDAGIPVQDIRRGMDYDTRRVEAVFLSHGHNDHLKGIEGLRIMGIPIFEPYKFEAEFQSAKYGGFSLRSFPLPHDGVENRGVYIVCPDGHRLLYMTDFEFCRYTFTAQKINTLLIECNYCKPYLIDADEGKTNHVLRGHASLDVAKGVVEANKTPELKNVILCHLSRVSADPFEILEAIEGVVDSGVNVRIARAGLQFDLTGGSKT